MTKQELEKKVNELKSLKQMEKELQTFPFGHQGESVIYIINQKMQRFNNYRTFFVDVHLFSSYTIQKEVSYG